jgi:hypothetical protein
LNDLNEKNDAALLGKLTLTASKIAKDMGFAEQGYRVVMNCNEQGGQTPIKFVAMMFSAANLVANASVSRSLMPWSTSIRLPNKISLGTVFRG